LGNLFAGVALQFDKPYEIGDWVDIESGGHKWIGQVYEISWRATVLISFTEEAITVPNRVVAQAQIANYSTKYRPIIRSQVFRIPFGSDVEKVKALLLESISEISEIRKVPSPRVLLSETNESWVGFKLVYFIEDFGRQFFIADQVITGALAHLKNAGIQLASHRISLKTENDSISHPENFS
jgi:small-conductance mechanosensitive channel